MGELLTGFGNAFTSSLLLAGPAALLWGALSVALSPCHLSSVPLVVAYMSGGAEMPTGRRALAISTAFAAGILVSIVAVGGITAAAGRMIGDIGRAGTWLVAGVFFVFGSNLLGILPLPRFAQPPKIVRARGAGGAVLLGLVFGAALGPCTFAFVAPLLGIVLHGSADRTGFGVVLVALFALGHAAAIAIAGASVQSVQRWLGWNGGPRTIQVLRAVAGVAVIAAGVYFIHAAS